MSSEAIETIVLVVVGAAIVWLGWIISDFTGRR